MDNKNKLLLVLAPVGILVGCYMVFGEYFPSEDKKNKAEESFTTIEEPVAEIRKKRTEVYQDKYEEENGKNYRKIESDDSFFNDEIKNDPNGNTEIPLRNTISSEPIDEQDEQQPVVKEKVIIKYVERPAHKENIQPTPVINETPAPEPKKAARQRTGFVSNNEEIKLTETTKSNNVITNDINIPAVVQDDINVKQGGNITLRTTEAGIINGLEIPKNTLVTGVVSVGQDRMQINISYIKSKSKSIPIKLSVYDLDGNEGMAIDGDIDTDIKKDAVNEVIGAARTIVNAPILRSLPTLGSKKVNDTSIPVPKGYKIFIKQ